MGSFEDNGEDAVNGEWARNEEASQDSHRDKERSQSRHRHRDRDHGSERSERERDRDRHHRRSHERDRSRDQDRKSRERSRDRDRHHRDYDSERRNRHRTRSRSRGKSRSRSRGRSRSRSRDRKSKRVSGFDMAPSNAGAIPGVAMPGQLPGMPQAMPNVMPGAFPFPGSQFGAFPTVPMQAMTQQATRHARRIYVGGLPPLANEQTIAAFFSQVMAAIGGNTAGPGDAVVNVYINHEKKFAFVEMRSVEEASNAMALNGIMFEGMPVRVRRPTDYNPTLAATLGPSQPSPHLNLAAVGLTPGCSSGADGPDKLFVGGVPYYLTETQIKELLESFGPLRGFDLVKDWETGNSKGYAFCVYQDPAVTDVVCAALNGLKMGDKTLTVRRASAGSEPKADHPDVFQQAQQQIAIQKLALQAAGAGAMGFGGLMPGYTMGQAGAVTEVPTKVVSLNQLVSVDDLRDDQEYADIYDDIKEECSKFGTVTKLVIPRPEGGSEVAGLGKAFVEYSDIEGARKAKASLHQRKFAGNSVIAAYYPEDKFQRGELDG
ncbi:hypothetical protein KP509_30G061500 [Ceratopteris richardii]|uniref:Splicing factor U2af large subunit n=2 Tax=Ceratopteris richardii TaxID=49495 RepID=A0A8T2R4P6_CERRI|nr:hypothetical protein KP509_30G061500 [Ceratopteris richardii]KAH7290733.1 hypothetical protein KP509_30G061500 [Ceratopteris richardii]